MNYGPALANPSKGTGVFNLDGGLFIAERIVPNNTLSTFNFNGGTLQATLSGVLASGLSLMQVRDGGAIFKTEMSRPDVGVDPSRDITLNRPLVHSTITGDAAIDGGLTKTGSGVLRLTVPNTYTGATVLNQGTLNINGDNNLGTVSAGLVLNAGTLQFANSVELNASRPVSLGSSGAIVTLDTQGHAVTLAGPVAGTNSLVKIGGGTLTLSGNASPFTGSVQVDAGGLVITGSVGTAGSSASLAVNGTAAAPAAVSLTQGSLTTGSTALLSSHGTFDQSGGTHHPGTLLVNASTYTLSGAGTIQAFSTRIGEGSATGRFNHLAGTNVAGIMSVGNRGTYTLGSGALRATWLSMNSDGARFVQQGGTNAVGTINIGAGIYALQGGTLDASSPAIVGGADGNRGLGTLNVTGGAFDASATSIYVGRGDYFNIGSQQGSGVVTLGNTASFRGGTEYIGYYYGDGRFTQSGGTHTVAASLNVGFDGATGTYTMQGGTLTLGTGGLVLGGTDGLDFAPNGTGTFDLQAGVVDANRSTLRSAANDGGGFLFRNGTLQNASQIRFAIHQQGGTFEAGKPGAPGGVSITGDGTYAYTLASAGTLRVELDSATLFDQVQTSAGLVNLLGGSLLLDQEPGYVASFGTQFPILTSSSPILGTFAQGLLVTSTSGQMFAVTYNAIAGGTYGVFLTPLAVPEPGLIAMLLPIAGVTLARRRRRDVA